MNVKIDKQVIAGFASIQERKQSGRWMIVKYDKSKGTASIDKLVNKEEKEDEDVVLGTFTEAVKAADPCWAFIEYKDTVFFVSYITENAPPTLKMPMAFNRGKFKGNFEGIKVDMECTDAGEIEPKAFQSKVKKVG